MSKFIIPIAASYAFMYTAVSFCMWNINPADWPSDSRAFMVAFGTLVAIFVSAVIGARDA